MAMQLRQIAAPGTILLSVATQHLVQEDVWMEPQGEVTVGATRAPVPVYGVRGIAQRRSGGVGHGARARSPFVGRGEGAGAAARATRRGDGWTGAGRRYRGGAWHGQAAAAEGVPPQSGWKAGKVWRGALSVLRQCRIVSASGGPRASALQDYAGESRAAITAKVRQRLQEADIAPPIDCHGTRPSQAAWRRQSNWPGGPWRSPASRSNGVARPGHSDSLGKLTCIWGPRGPSKPKPTTSRLSPGRGTGYAAARGPLPLWSRHAVRQDRPD